MEVLPTAGAMQLNRIVGAYSRAIVLVATYRTFSVLGGSMAGLPALTVTAAFDAL
jgi:hypothetical protein